MLQDLVTSIAESGLFLFNFVLVLSVLVAVHEYGHYIVARWCKVRILTFSIGFGREIFGWTDKSGTRWKFSLIPLGGFVKMFGDIDPATQRQLIADRRAAWEARCERELAAGRPMPPAPDLPEYREPTREERAVSFVHKPLWQRAAIVAAGPAANLLLAALIYSGIFYGYGELLTPAILESVEEGTPAAAAGLQPGDQIVAIDGDPVESFEEFSTIIMFNPSVPLDLTIQRGGAQLVRTVEPARILLDSETGEVIPVDAQGQPLGGAIACPTVIGRIGVTNIDRVSLDHTLPSAVWTGITHTVTKAERYLVGLWQVVSGLRDHCELGGPIRIAQYSNLQAARGLLDLVAFIAALSIGLALVNLLPIPILDGGHLFMYAIEALRGRPMDYRVMDVSFRIGLVILLSFMAFVFVNDLRLLFQSS